MELLANGRSALLSFQRALAVTSHNISNVNTEGFTRQEISFSSRIAGQSQFNAGYGAGVEVGTVERAYDKYLNRDMQEQKSLYTGADNYTRFANEIDDLFANSETGLAVQSQDFFRSIQAVASDPTSIAERQTLVSDAQMMTSRFREIDDRIDNVKTTTDGMIRDAVSDVNLYAKQVAELNNKIMNQGSNGQTPNDLMDQRDLLISKIGEQLNVTTIEMPDHTTSVFVGNGNSLVRGGVNYSMSTAPSKEYGYNQLGIFIDGKNTSSEITPQVTSGTAGGLLQFQRDILTPADNRVGRMAAVLGQEFNQQYAQGWDLNGDPGIANFFNIEQPVATVMNGGSTMTATFLDDTSQLEASNYTMRYDGSSWEMTRMSDGKAVSFTGTGSAGDPILAEGLSIVTAGAPTSGDVVLIQPYRDMSAKFTTNVTDPRAIAASQTDPAVDAGSFGDNTNMLALFQLQETRLFDKGQTTFDGAYGHIVAEVGNKAAVAQSSLSARKIIYEQAVNAREMRSGVNLDEEAANLMRYQQAYIAAAKVMSAADEMFQSLINNV
ncbi:MAG: flagellar hook-associated protein FlgK [Gammaproteobacteria bacterium]|nr:flagellar hook-associated protein FlgK [Gammaproteobacteria bacterium]